MLGGIIASLVIIAALYGMVKFRADDFDKTMMFGLVAFIALLWVVPWGIFVLIPLTLVVSFPVLPHEKSGLSSKIDE